MGDATQVRDKELRGLLQLMANQNPSPTTVPVPIAALKAARVYFITSFEPGTYVQWCKTFPFGMWPI